MDSSGEDSLKRSRSWVRIDGDGVALCAVDFGVFAAEGPVPRGHEDGLGTRVAQDDGGVVVDAGIDLRLVGLGDGSDAERGFAVHEPGHEVGAVAAEVVESAGAVLGGIGEPLEEFGLDADFFRALMAVVNDDFADFAEAPLLEQVVDRAIAGVPGGLVIDEDLDVVFAGGAADGEGVVKG